VEDAGGWLVMAKFKRTKPNNPKPDLCESVGCMDAPTCVLGGFWFCADHGSRDYEKGGGA